MFTTPQCDLYHLIFRMMPLCDCSGFYRLFNLPYLYFSRFSDFVLYLFVFVDVVSKFLCLQRTTLLDKTCEVRTWGNVITVLSVTFFYVKRKSAITITATWKCNIWKGGHTSCLWIHANLLLLINSFTGISLSFLITNLWLLTPTLSADYFF